MKIEAESVPGQAPDTDSQQAKKDYKIEQGRAELLSNRQREPVIASSEVLKPRNYFVAKNEPKKELDPHKLKREMRQIDGPSDGQSLFEIHDNEE